MANFTHRQIHAKNSPKLSNTRYHVDEPQRFGHLKPGLPSKKLRKALGLHDDQIPAYIYKMRNLGYPPGWLKEAEINHSNMALYVEQDKALPDHGDEDGEISADKTQYDVDKIQEWPGFNIECDFEHVFTDESDYYRVGPMRSDQSKEAFVSNIGTNCYVIPVFCTPAYLRSKILGFTFIRSLILCAPAYLHLFTQPFICAIGYLFPRLFALPHPYSVFTL